jgi:hypothetical protein
MRLTTYMLTLLLLITLPACGDDAESVPSEVDGAGQGDTTGDTGPADVADGAGDMAVTPDGLETDAPDPGDITQSDVPADLSGDTGTMDASDGDAAQVVDGTATDTASSPDGDTQLSDMVMDVAPDAAPDVAVDAGSTDITEDTGQPLPPWACTAEQPCTGPNEMCFGPEDDFCGMCMDPVSPCDADGDCVEGMVCGGVPPCSCSGQTECTPACILGDECGVGKTCDEGGHCEPAPCASDDACPANFACTTGACIRMSCAASSECDGHCVKGKCHGIPGNCSPPPP